MEEERKEEGRKKGRNEGKEEGRGEIGKEGRKKEEKEESNVISQGSEDRRPCLTGRSRNVKNIQGPF